MRKPCGIGIKQLREGSFKEKTSLLCCVIMQGTKHGAGTSQAPIRSSGLVLTCGAITRLWPLRRSNSSTADSPRHKVNQMTASVPPNHDSDLGNGNLERLHEAPVAARILRRYAVSPGV